MKLGRKGSKDIWRTSKQPKVCWRYRFVYKQFEKLYKK